MATIRVLNKKNGAAGEYIGRGSPLGNPYRVAPHGPHERGTAIALYAAWLDSRIAAGDRAVTAELARLTNRARTRGKLDLVCFCAPLACHGDVIRKIILDRLGTTG